MKIKLAIIGSGGFAREVYALTLSSGFDAIGFIDNNDDQNLPKPILGHEQELLYLKDKYNLDAVFIAVGNPSTRSRIHGDIKDLIAQPTLIHPSSTVLSNEIGSGTVVYPNATVMNDCTIGNNCIINAGVTLGHDTKISNFCNINPGANIAGRVCIGEGTTIGIGASIKENIKIGKNVVIGAGANVVRDIPDNVTVVGNPADVRDG